MSAIFSTHWVLIASLWYFFNGLLHDIFVLIRHKGGYDRELLRLLTDGHLLMFSGVILFACYFMILNKIHQGTVIAIIVSSGMLIYCGMIFPFLKSFGTIAISIMVIVACLRS